jgi:type I restriction enzyme S subunit
MKPWLKDLPAQWTVRSLQYLCEIGTGERDTIDATDDGEVPFYIRSKRVERIDKPTHHGEAILTPGDGSVGEVFHHHRSGPFAAHQRVYVLNNFVSDLDVRFFYWYFSATFRFVTGQGTAKSTVESLRRPMFLSFPVSFPPKDDQRVRADYLDRETAEIDAMDADLDRLLSVLKERRQSAAGHIFEELFAGPVIPLWSVLSPMKDQNHVSEDVLSVYRDYGVIPKDSRDDNHNRTPADLSPYQLVMPGDLVMNKMKAWQGSLGMSEYRGIVSPDYQVARPIVEADTRYLHEVLRSPMMVPQYRAYSRGVRPSQWRLYWDDFSHLRIPLPDLGTQRRVVEDLTRGNREVEAMRSDAVHLKELLAERRTNLVTEVVTGRREVL